MAHAHCVLRNKGYRHTQRIRNTYCLSTATMVKLYVHSPSCYHIHVIFDSLHPLMELIRNNPWTALVKGENHHVLQSYTVTSLRSVCAIDYYINLLAPNDPYIGRTAPLTSRYCILYIYSRNVGTEYCNQVIFSPFFLFKMQFVS